MHIAAKPYKNIKHVRAFVKNIKIQLSGLGRLAGRLTWPQICFEPADANFLSLLIRI